MGLTKQYLRFVPGPVFGIIASAAGSVLFVNSDDKKSLQVIAVPACENVQLWNYRTGERVGVLLGEKHSVTCMVGDPTGKNLAVGYSDGTVRVFSLTTRSCLVTFSGHKSPVSCLAYDQQSLRLASGGKDTEIVLWDLVGESGLFRLKGHKGPITKCHFFRDHNILISSSADTLLKFWDLDSQHCFKTVMGNRGEVLDFTLIGDCRLLTGANDVDLIVWDLQFKDSPGKELQSAEGDALTTESDDLDIIALTKVGKILIEGEKKIQCIRVDKLEQIFGCYGSSKIHLFKVLSTEEATKKFRRRRRKEQKHRMQGNEDNIPESSTAISLSDVIGRLNPIKVDAKIVAFDLKADRDGRLKICASLNNNSFSVYDLDTTAKSTEPLLLCSAQTGGHRNNVNTLSFSSDGLTMLSASGESAKIWNVDSQCCTHTFNCDTALCSAFLTGNNYCAVGTKSGTIQLFDLPSRQLVENVEAHAGSVTTLCKSPDQKGVTSGGSDREVKFWEYELIKDNNYSENKKRLTLIHTRTLKLTEEVLCIKYGPNHKFIAVSLLDCTVKIFFCDTLKFAFSLYGHKLPVPCLDISYDSTLLVTGSRDRNVKIWSLEFGNCLKSLFAHEDSVTCVQFLPKTHMFFSAGKDGKLKQWDADNFQKILTLDGHQSKITALAVSPDGAIVATSSQDKSLRLWEKTREPLVLEEEQEIEREKEIDKDLTSEEPVIAGEANKEVGLASKTTIMTLKSVEQLIEALEVHKSEIIKLQEHRIECKRAGKDLPLPAPDPMLLAYSVTCPYEYMLKVLRKSRSACVEETLLHLPFNYVIELLHILTEFSARNWDVELTTKCILFLVRIHLRQISVSKDAFPLVDKLKKFILEELGEIKDIIGFNSAGLKFLQRQIDGAEETSLIDEALQKFSKKRNRKRHLITFV